MTEEDLLQTILENPAEDLPRLVYADKLEEQGTPEAVARCEFIRLGVAISNSGLECSQWNGCVNCKMRRRHLKLWNRHGCNWQREFYGPLMERKVAESLASGRSIRPDWRETPASCKFFRGFVSAITLPRSSLQCLSAILRANPIEVVTVDGVKFRIIKGYMNDESKDVTFNVLEWFGRLAPRSIPYHTREELVAGIGDWIESVLPVGSVDARLARSNSAVALESTH